MTFPDTFLILPLYFLLQSGDMDEAPQENVHYEMSGIEDQIVLPNWKYTDIYFHD